MAKILLEIAVNEKSRRLEFNEGNWFELFLFLWRMHFERASKVISPTPPQVTIPSTTGEYTDEWPETLYGKSVGLQFATSSSRLMASMSERRLPLNPPMNPPIITKLSKSKLRMMRNGIFKSF